jgi:hypothetical protein
VSVDVERPSTKRDAKAELKAAKAYAKAQRPWYKKKRWVLSLGPVLLVVAIAVASSLTTSGNSASNSGEASSQTTGENAGGGDTGKSGGVGEELTNAGTTYEVTRVTTATTIGDPELGGARADGKFVIVSLALTNNKDETKTFTEGSAHIETADGKKYETSDKTVLAFGEESLLLKDIQPELTAKGKLAFDLPPNKINGAKLVIEDLFGDGEIKVDLGV